MAIRNYYLAAIAGLVLTFGVMAMAQEALPDRPRYALTLPPNCELVEVNGLKAICDPADRTVVEGTLKSLQPTTRPTTMPADLLTRLQAVRPELVKQIAQEFAINDTKGIEAQLDKLAEDLKKLDEFRPPIFYLCLRAEKLKAMLKAGEWTSPSVYYNRLMDEVMFRETVPLTLERPMDDAIMAVLRDKTEDDAAYQVHLQRMVNSSQAEVARLVSGRGQFLSQMMLIDAVMQEVFVPLKMAADQQWLGTGLAGIASADYAHQIIGSPRKELLLLIAAELRKNPIRMRTVDLLHPADNSSLKRQYIVAYADAYRRKSMSVCLKIMDKARAKVPDLIKSLREKPCADGSELVKRVREVTGVDVSRDVGAQ